MVCPNCGAESDESANFCRDCGHTLSAAREDGKEDTKATAILTAIRSLDGVGDELLNRPEIGYLPSVLEDGERPDFIVAGAYGTGCLVATNRRIINVERSGSGSSFKCRSFAYSEVLSFEASTGIFSGTVGIHKSDGKTEHVLVEKSRTRVFVGHVNAKILPTEEMGDRQAEGSSEEGQVTSDGQPERSDKSEGTERTGSESEGDTEKNQKKANSQQNGGSGNKKGSDPSNKQAIGCLAVGAIAVLAFIVWGIFSSGCHNPMVAFSDQLEARTGVEIRIHESQVEQVADKKWNIVAVYANRVAGDDPAFTWTARGYSEETENGCVVRVTSTGY